VIVATNIAETSITIDGISHVVDSGFFKEKAFDGGIDSLKVKYTKLKFSDNNPSFLTLERKKIIHDLSKTKCKQTRISSKLKPNYMVALEGIMTSGSSSEKTF